MTKNQTVILTVDPVPVAYKSDCQRQAALALAEAKQ